MGCDRLDLQSIWLISTVTWAVNQLDDAFQQQASVHPLSIYGPVGIMEESPALTGLTGYLREQKTKK